MSKQYFALGSALTIASINLASSIPVSAQLRPIQPIQPIQPQVSQVDASTIRLNKRAPLRFQSFELQDPETGKPIAPGEMLTLPDNRQVNAGEYYAELNRFEQEFSQLGYSLRQPEEKVLLQESTIDAAILKPQLDVIDKSHHKITNPAQTLFRTTLDPQQAMVDLQQTPSLQIKPGALQQLQVSPQLTELQVTPILQPTLSPIAPLRSGSVLTDIRIKPDRLKDGVLAPIPKPKNPVPSKTYSKSWNSGTIGSKGTFGADLNAKLNITGHPTFTNAYAEGNANGYAFNRSINLLRATASTSSQKSGQASMNLQLNAVGQTIYNFQDSKNTLLVKSDSFAKSYDKTIADVRFTVGPIPMRAVFGAQATAGIRYFVIANPGGGNVYAKVNPFLDSKVYGQGGADIVVGGAGVGANLVLLKDDLDIRGSASVGFEDSKPYLRTQLSAYNEMTALSGNSYAYAYIYVPRWGIPPWRKKQWDWNIFSWSGLKTDGYLFDESYKAYF